MFWIYALRLLNLTLHIRLLFIYSRFCQLQATAPGLKEKLGKLAPAYDVAGHTASYFVERLVAYMYCFHIVFPA